MKVYLAARFDRRDELREHRRHLKHAFNIDCTSRWLDNHGLDEGFTYSSQRLALCASEDIEDIRAADVLVAFTETPDVGYTSGGRHVELGFALALGKPIIVVGSIENVFHQLCSVDQIPMMRVDDWHQATVQLRRIRKAAA